MVFEEDGSVSYGYREPRLRSCPRCNGFHQHLLNVNRVHTCFLCGKSWVLGRYFDEFESDEELYKFLQEHREELESDFNCKPIIITNF